MVDDFNRMIGDSNPTILSLNIYIYVTENVGGYFLLLAEFNCLALQVQYFLYDQLFLTLKTFCSATVPRDGNLSIICTVVGAVFHFLSNFCDLSQ